MALFENCLGVNTFFSFKQVDLMLNLLQEIIKRIPYMHVYVSI